MNMDESQQEDTDSLKLRARHDTTADFVQALAEWGFNYHEHTLLWEAMVSVIEAEERDEYPLYPLNGSCIDGCKRCGGSGYAEWDVKK